MGTVFIRVYPIFFEKNQNLYKKQRKQIYRYKNVNYDALKYNFEYEIENNEIICYINISVKKELNQKMPLLDYIEEIKKCVHMQEIQRSLFQPKTLILLFIYILKYIIMKLKNVIIIFLIYLDKENHNNK